MSMIRVSDLTFAYPGSYDTIFEHASFQLDTDWKLGFTGRNGRGKTTFLNLLLGNYEYSGTITTDAAFDYFPYPVADGTAMTLDVLAEICPGAEEWELMRELGLLEADCGILYRPFETLSNGERTKALLAALFCNEGRFLLIDEPTNHLDSHGRRAVAEYLRRKRGFLLVSHDRAFLDGCVDHILSINKANIEVQSGNFSSWWENRQRQDAWELAENDRLRREIGRLRAASARTAVWSDKVERTKNQKTGGLRPDKGYIGHKAAKMMQRSKSIESRRQQAVEETAGLLRNVERADSLKLSPLTFHSRRLAELRETAVVYDGRAVCGPLDLEIGRGERIALEGPNGCGKSSLLKLLAGERVPHTGRGEVPGQLVLSVVPQETDWLRGDLREFIRAGGVDETLFLAVLRKLDLDRVQFGKDLADWSGGQKKKALLARSLCQQAHLYLWDEPLNFIDVYSRMQIEELLLAFRPSMVFVEHDAAFRRRIATRTVGL